MLARAADIFDSDDHLFEIKWDGMRAQLRVDDRGYSLINRRQREVTQRFPEFDWFRELEPGLLLDGEIVVLEGGKPRFDLLLGRENQGNARRIEHQRRVQPATFVAFDLLYRSGEPVLERPLRARRQILQTVLDGEARPGLILSAGISGAGRDYFAAALDQELEGVMAKRLDSSYAPGTRSDMWLKIKRKRYLQCAIVGYLAPDGDLRSLIIAAQMDGRLRCVGKVGSGIGGSMRATLMALLAARRRETPWLDCGFAGLWVEPGLYCNVSYLESTRAGHLRAPVFLDLIRDE
jgi:DNA ligase D-like protein (predicted ligase)